jgi:transmembrane sensor
LSPDFYHITDDLLVKYLLGEASTEERLLVEEWLAADEAHRKQYEDLKTIWDESKRLAAVSTVDEDAAWARFKNRMKDGGNEKAVVRKMPALNWIKIAALFILVAGAVLIGYQMFSEEKVEALSVVSKAVPVVDTLPDGSVVTLNKNSSLEYPSRFKGETRTIALKGEAFFDVKPNKEKPFIINVNDVEVKSGGHLF